MFIFISFFPLPMETDLHLHNSLFLHLSSTHSTWTFIDWVLHSSWSLQARYKLAHSPYYMGSFYYSQEHFGMEESEKYITEIILILEH